MKRIIPALAIALLAFGSVRAERTCSPDQAYSDPLGSIGCVVELSGRVQKIISASFPMEFVIKSSGNLFLVQYFSSPGSAGTALTEGKKYAVKGTLLGAKQVLYNGSMVKLPLVYCAEIR